MLLSDTTVAMESGCAGVMNNTLHFLQRSVDSIKWIAVLVLIGGGIYANAYVYAAQSALYRALGLLALGALAFGILLTTAQGRNLWSLMRESRTELRQVVWPSRTETLQTTLLVLLATAILSMILWGLDTLFGWLITLSLEL